MVSVEVRFDLVRFSPDTCGPDGFVSFLLKHSASQLYPKARRFLGIIADSAKEMGQLIDDLLDFSRMSRAEMQCTLVNLHELALALHAHAAHVRQGGLLRAAAVGHQRAGGGDDERALRQAAGQDAELPREVPLGELRARVDDEARIEFADRPARGTDDRAVDDRDASAAAPRVPGFEARRPWPLYVGLPPTTKQACSGHAGQARGKERDS